MQNQNTCKSNQTYCKHSIKNIENNKYQYHYTHQNKRNNVLLTPQNKTLQPITIVTIPKKKPPVNTSPENMKEMAIVQCPISPNNNCAEGRTFFAASLTAPPKKNYYTHFHIVKVKELYTQKLLSTHCRDEMKSIKTQQKGRV